MSSRPCPQCRLNNHDSKGDHLFLMKDGKTWACFNKDYHSTGKPYFEGEDGEVRKSPSHRESTGRETIEEVLTFPLVNFELRGIRPDTFKHFEGRVSYSEVDGSPAFIYFPLKSKGEVVGFHKRDLTTKAFSNIGGIAGRDLDLFGVDKCAKTGKNIIVCEGHLDALSTYQVIKDKYNKINPNIVSVNNGLGSIKDIANSVSDLNAYESVLLSFDMDQPGRDGIAKVAKLLGSKIKIMELSCKDANEALTANKGHEIINAIFNPREYVPSDVVTLHDLRDSILAETPQGLPWEWDGLSDLTYGIFPQQIISIGAAPGAGKALMHGEVVLTKNGPARVEDLKVGGKVLNTSGLESTILGVYPQGLRPIYRVSFTDGTSLSVDEDHLWTLNKTRGSAKITLSTKELLLKYKQGGDKKKIFHLPNYSPLVFDHKDFQINPYLLGAWIGDGSALSGVISCPIGKIDESCLADYKFSYSEKYQQYSIKGLKVKLRDLNLISNKHIPEKYFYGSVEQRSLLLKGLLDTDGHNQGRKGYYFDNTIESVVDGVVRLARSLGMVAKRTKTKEEPYYKDKNGNKIICKPCYRCVVKVKDGRTSKRYVSGVSYEGVHLATCISVDSEDHLFIAGDFIPTHNTVFINQLSSYLMRTFKKKIALFSLEETPTYTGKKLVGSLIGKRLHLPGVKGGEGEVDAIIEELKDYLYIYDTQGFLSWEDIKTNIRYLASLGVEFFVIDPLTAVTAMCSASEANEVLNGMMADLSTLVQSLNITVFLVSHLNNPKTGKMHSEGGVVSGEQFTQSRALQRWSHVVLGLERNLQSEDEEEKNTMTVRIIKSRLVGKTGTVPLRYQEDTGRLEEVNDDSSYGV